MIAVFGAGGCAKELDWLIDDLNAAGNEKISLDVFVAKGGSGDLFLQRSLMDEEHFFESYAGHQDISIFIALGDCFIREKVYRQIKARLSGSVAFPTVIHPSAKLDTRNGRFSIGIGNMICAGTTIMPDVAVGNFNYISLHSIIGHDSVVGDFVTIFPGARIAGHVSIGDRVLIGTSTIIIENIKVCSDVRIGAGSVVTRSITEPGTYVGVPARKIK